MIELWNLPWEMNLISFKLKMGNAGGGGLVFLEHQIINQYMLITPPSIGMNDLKIAINVWAISTTWQYGNTQYFTNLWNWAWIWLKMINHINVCCFQQFTVIFIGEFCHSILIVFGLSMRIVLFLPSSAIHYLSLFFVIIFQCTIRSFVEYLG